MLDYFKNRNNLKKELDSLNIYISNIEDENIKSRIGNILEWYVRKAEFYKNLFYLLSMTLIVINAMIPVISQLQLNNKNIIISFGSSVATIISSSLTLFTAKDTWFRYRNHAELIKEECVKYNALYGDYESARNQSMLSKNIESIIKSERDLWKNNRFNDEYNNDGN